MITDKSKYLCNHGFSLVEILVALFLLTIMAGYILTVGFSTSNSMDEALNNLERAVRFAENESALRNVITRVQFELDKNPQEYVVENGPDDSFVLPPRDLQIMGEAPSTESESEQYDLRIKNINKQFNRVREFSDDSVKLPPNIQIIGVGTSISQQLVTNFLASIYIYPTGEKDGAIVILASDDEVVSLSVSPFTQDFEKIFKPIELLNADQELEEVKLNLAKEIYEEWIKN